MRMNPWLDDEICCRCAAAGKPQYCGMPHSNVSRQQRENIRMKNVRRSDEGFVGLTLRSRCVVRCYHDLIRKLMLRLKKNLLLQHRKRLAGHVTK
jgi:hypothetical protein